MLKTGSTVLKLILGLFFIGSATFLLLGLEWWRDTYLFLKGVIPLVLLLLGIITLVIAKE